MSRFARVAAATVVWIVLISRVGANGEMTADRVRQACLKTYIHGVTAELARAEVGKEGLPELQRLLADPTFPRRDNVVAFLSHLGDEGAARSLQAFLQGAGPSPEIPEEDRALLLAPQALGMIASRGSSLALGLLMKWTEAGSGGGGLARAAQRAPSPDSYRDDLLEMALRGLAWSGAASARDRLIDLARGRLSPVSGGRDFAGPARAALNLWEELKGRAPAATEAGSVDQDPLPSGWIGVAPIPAGSDPSPSAPEAFDPATRVHNSPLTYANHVSHPSPMTDTRLDLVLKESSLRAGRADFSGDVACCITVSRSGTGKTFGSAGDGLDVIDNSTELNQVLNNSIARVKVVRVINYCGGPGTGIIGCAWAPGNGMAVVRTSDLGTEAVLWIHEFGHNTGLGHDGGPLHIMGATDSGYNSGLYQYQCNSYHSPSGSSGMSPVNTGVCADPDHDEVQNGIDNCPGAINSNQADAEGDGVGDACDNCPALSNPDQLNTDTDAEGNACDPDDDADGILDGADCSPLDGGVWSAPDVCSGMKFHAGSLTTLEWTRGNQGQTSNLYRGTFGPTFDPHWSCLAPGLTGTSQADPAKPAAGGGFHYLVTSENICGESGAGAGSNGVPRHPTPCP